MVATDPITQTKILADKDKDWECSRARAISAFALAGMTVGGCC